jgi:hypothetical protein
MAHTLSAQVTASAEDEKPPSVYVAPPMERMMDLPRDWQVWISALKERGQLYVFRWRESRENKLDLRAAQELSAREGGAIVTRIGEINLGRVLDRVHKRQRDDIEGGV